MFAFIIGYFSNAIPNEKRVDYVDVCFRSSGVARRIIQIRLHILLISGAHFALFNTMFLKFPVRFSQERKIALENKFLQTS